MRLFLKKIFLIYLISFLTIQPCFAGDIMPAGTTLAEDSYVFTIEEATALLNRVEELEVKELKLEHYLELDEVYKHKFSLYESNIDIYKFQISEYENIMGLNNAELERLHRGNKHRWLENYGMIAIGMALTIGAFVIADNITDQLETN